MGNASSSQFDLKQDDVWWENSQQTNELQENTSLCLDETLDFTEKKLSEESIRKLEEFKLELARKREKRKEIIGQKSKEMEELREEVKRLREENEALQRGKRERTATNVEKADDNALELKRLKEENETLKMLVTAKGRLLEESEKIIQQNREMRIEASTLQEELQRLNTEVLNFEKERQDYKTHVVALKEVITVSKNMLKIRDTELAEVRAKISEIEKSLAEKETLLLSKTLRSEYERQMGNIRELRALYEERQRTAAREKEEMMAQVNEAKKDLEDQQDKNKDLQDRITQLEEDNSKKYDEIMQLESNMGIVKAECRQYQAELRVINQLFSEILLGFNTSQEIDLDKLQKHLEDHHGLLQDIVVNEVASSSYALPKVLLNLVSQVEAKKDEETSYECPSGRVLETIQEESESATSTLHNQVNSPEEIVENLPKVWRVLIELLSHQIAPVNELSENADSQEHCYKTVQTAGGPSVVLSVSQTFIRLKDLILEKKSLEKETNHLKELNGHLENRLQDQEKRLQLVQSELSKTWLIVGKLQKQHQMLHTQEKILRYELAQKRKLLTQLKEELEYSREKWAQAREKNTSTEAQWKLLRTEFASRKSTLNDDLNNSAESGYSDDKECSSSDDERSYEESNIRRDPENFGASSHTLTDMIEEKGEDVKLSCATIVDPQMECCPVETNIESDVLTDSTSIELSDTESSECLERKKVDEKSESTSQQSALLPTVDEYMGISEIPKPTELPQTGEVSLVVLEALNPGEPNENLQTWERVSDIVQQEILRLTDQVKKTDSNSSKDSETFLLEDSVTEASQLEKTDLNNRPSTSSRTLEEVLAARNERFKRLEEQAQQLRDKVVNTNKRSDEMSNKLDNLHEAYGQSADSICRVVSETDDTKEGQPKEDSDSNGVESREGEYQ